MMFKTFINTFNIFLLSFIVSTLSVNATEIESAENLKSNGSIEVIGRELSETFDPENPESIIDAGDSPHSSGDLRIDFASQVNFGEMAITKTNRKYNALAQSFSDGTTDRGNFILVTDQRAGSKGWTLQLKQKKQFLNEKENMELKGAVLSFDKAWANSTSLSETPTVTRDTLAINNFDTAYDVARASENAGRGIWAITFGASINNSNNQEPTLQPLLDKEGERIMDNQTALTSNSAISLTIPDSTQIYPGSYKTELTWIIAELP